VLKPKHLLFITTITPYLNNYCNWFQWSRENKNNKGTTWENLCSQQAIRKKC